MRLIESIREMTAWSREQAREGRTIGFVPTMGYLHEGHLTLMRRAREACDRVVVSIFVNPLQFGAGEDFAEYPRDLIRDSRLAESAGVDVLFAPSAREMYPKGYHTFVDVERLTEGLCGASRPGHFRGVTTVVCKLFNIVRPDVAYFGQKDAQQLAVIRRMTEDLNLPVSVVGVPIVREADGLAMSSRNVYLSPQERQAALVLSRALARARELIEGGERDVARLRQIITETITAEPLAAIDYVSIVDNRFIQPVETLAGECLIALAVRIGKRRLIDNMVVEV
ncbi:pantoate--beta-alanine ligase [Heliomicrobium modesticaldum Ice1]|uniref:Pantothenate synthetase n=1 Tax=Heliobacterium modesticaldum (strain ATCC 51547 / Ice1) TaxID=498761 RepID=PANC_HELMI|nr:pantoate--beta-alanine ligase [Heliomicrobium modesticaldum]B0TBP5.1 RecName: Full=Pantothenate synthetase; Short=PS; AltName: Full=Pantoate--beta-alanine ligase; AltName: Full=Pantoate-activating enzyme [Heliomicrobium modesticaldum Ice1]ABZ83884.1 pantoate--beta-alanine ligase [Heliomicrobium modesticaldum Ice1]